MASDMEHEHSRELLDRVSAGDRDALAELVVRMTPLIRGRVERRAPREALARETPDDLAQSVCREVLERIDRGAFEYRGEAEFRAWLVGAVDLKLGERWRRAHTRRREADLDAAELGPVEVPADATSPSEALARGEDRQRFERLLARLSEEDRRIVVGVHVEGRRHAEIARELGFSESHSRTRLARALARLATWTRADR